VTTLISTAARAAYDGNQPILQVPPMIQLQPMAFPQLHMPSYATFPVRAAHEQASADPEKPTRWVTEGHAAMPAATNPNYPAPASLENPVARLPLILSEHDVSFSPKGEGPRARPKRALTAYNIFFKDQRAKILVELEGDEESIHTSYGTKQRRRRRPHGKIGFEEMAKMIGKKWKGIGPEELAYYKAMAASDKKRLEAELALFMKEECDVLEAARAALEATVSEETKRLYFGRKNYE
jgi:hypothetical protein